MENVSIASEVAHEIKNPLAVIKANIDLLCQTQLNDENQHSFLVIKNEINKLDNLVKRFLKFDNEKLFAKNYIYVLDVIENIISEIKFTYPYVTFNIGEIYKDMAVEGFEYHIYLIFSNIIKNSMEAMNYEGEINISLTDQEGLGVIKIEDNGVGISEEDEKKIMDSFYTTKKTGTGIGLTIIKNIISMYNGDFYIKAGQICGAVAVVKLPLADL